MICLLDGDVIKVSEEVQITILPEMDGVPFASMGAMLPIQDVDKAWYEATRRYGAYNYHPHRCEDLNLESGGNTDLGETLVAPFNSLVIAAGNLGGDIGRVVQLLGIVRGQVVVWAGWHLNEIRTATGALVQAGDMIGTVGNADGRYRGAHLHHQICVVDGKAGVPRPWTFPSDDRYDWRQPSRFFKENGVDPELVDRVHAWDSE